MVQKGKVTNGMKSKRIAILAPVAWRTPPRAYGAWETVASNITEGLVARGWKDVTLFATKESITKAKLAGWIEKGYEEDKTQIPKVSECLHISKVMERADEFDLIHNNFDYLPLTYIPFIKTPMLTTIHGFSDPDILRVYHDHKDAYYVSISDSDRDKDLPYLATVYNGIDLSNLTFRETSGDKLVHYGRIHPDKGTHLAIEVAKKSGKDLIIAGIIKTRIISILSSSHMLMILRFGILVRSIRFSAMRFLKRPIRLFILTLSPNGSVWCWQNRWLRACR